jgi:hypothetical protein
MVGQTSSGGVWKAMMEMFSSQSKARVVELRTQLNKAQKENKTAEVYFNHIKNLADEMAAAGKPLGEDDVISYILAGLNDEAYNDFVVAITALIKADKYVSLTDLYSQLLSYEARLEDQNSVGDLSVDAARRGGRGGYRGGRGGGHGNYSDPRGYDQQRSYEYRGYEQRGYEQHGNGQHGGCNSRGSGGGNGGRGQGYRPLPQNYGGDKPTCQVCGKIGQIALNCWKRFQKNYRGPEKSVGAAIGNYVSIQIAILTLAQPIISLEN